MKRKMIGVAAFAMVYLALGSTSVIAQEVPAGAQTEFEGPRAAELTIVPREDLTIRRPAFDNPGQPIAAQIHFVNRPDLPTFSVSYSSGAEGWTQGPIEASFSPTPTPVPSARPSPEPTPEPAAAAIDVALSNVILHFQLIQAEDGAPSDPRIAEVEAALRGLLRFTGYRLIGDGIVQVSGGGSDFSQSLTGSPRFLVSGTVSEVQIRAPAFARVEELRLWATEPVGSDATPLLLETTLNVRGGQVVVVGSIGAAGGAPMFLTVKAEIDRTLGGTLPAGNADEEIALRLSPPAIPLNTLASSPRSGFLFDVEGFNRISGLSVRLGPSFLLGEESTTRVETTLIWRSAGRADFQTHAIGYQAKIDRSLGESGLSIGGEVFSRINPVSGWTVAPENSLSSFFLSLDHGDYYESRGGRAFLSFGRESSTMSGSLDYTRERIGSVASASPWSLLHSGRLSRDQPLMAEGTFHSIGAEVTLDTRNRKDNPTDGWFVQASLRRGVSGELLLPQVGLVSGAGSSPLLEDLPTEIDSRVSHLQIDLRRYIPVGPGVGLNLRGIVAGSPTGERLPPHLQNALGGIGTLPGHSVFAADCGARSSRVSLARDGVDRSMYPYFGCDRVALFQAEYRGTLRGILGRESLRVGSENLTPHWAFFFDAGKGWASSEWGDLARTDSPVLYDAGVGLLLGKMGIYWAKPLGKAGGESTLTLRLGRRF